MVEDKIPVSLIEQFCDEDATKQGKHPDEPCKYPRLSSEI